MSDIDEALLRAAHPALPVHVGRAILPPLVAAAGNTALRALTLGSKFVLTVVLARLLGPESLGVYGLAAAAMALGVFALGLEYHYFTIRRLVPLSASDRAALIRDQLVLYLLLLVVAVPMLAVAFARGALTAVPHEAQGWFLALLGVELLAQELGVALIALERAILSNLVLFVRSAAWIYIVVPILLWNPALGLDTVFLSWLVGALLSLAVAGYALRDLGWHDAGHRGVDWAMLRHGLGVAAPFVVTTGASLGILFLDRFIIERALGLEAVGVYTFFAAITTALHSLVNSGVSVIRVPRLVQAHQAHADKVFHRELGIMALMTSAAVTVIAGVLMLSIDALLRLAGRDVYGLHRDVFLMLLAAASIRCLADIPLYGLYARHRDGALLGVTLLAFGVSTAVNLAAIPTLGLMGAAAGAVSGAATLLVASAVAATAVR